MQRPQFDYPLNPSPNPAHARHGPTVAEGFVARAIRALAGRLFAPRDQSPIVRKSLQTLALARSEAADLLRELDALNLAAGFQRVSVVFLNPNTIRPASWIRAQCSGLNRDSRRMRPSRKRMAWITRMRVAAVLRAGYLRRIEGQHVLAAVVPAKRESCFGAHARVLRAVNYNRRFVVASERRTALTCNFRAALSVRQTQNMRLVTPTRRCAKAVLHLVA